MSDRLGTVIGIRWRPMTSAANRVRAIEISQHMSQSDQNGTRVFLSFYRQHDGRQCLRNSVQNRSPPQTPEGTLSPIGPPRPRRCACMGPSRERRQRSLTFPQIVAASRAAQLYAAEKLSIKALRFIVCNLLPPPKKQVLAYLGIPLAPGQGPEAHPRHLPRKAEIDVSIPANVISPKIRS